MLLFAVTFFTGLPAAAAEADVIFTCLPNTDATKARTCCVCPIFQSPILAVSSY